MQEFTRTATNVILVALEYLSDIVL